MAALDGEQAAAFLAAARGHEYEVPLFTALYTGLRLGELLGVRWKGVDLDSGRLSVQQTLQRCASGGGMRPAVR